MRGLLHGWLVAKGLLIFLIIGAISAAFQNVFGDYAGEAFWLMVAAAAIATAYFSVRAILAAKRDVRRILVELSNGEDGPFTRWFDGQTRWENGDFIPRQKIPRLFAKAYGGMNRVALLLREGFDHVVADDLVAVLGEGRAALALDDLEDACAPADLGISVFGFLAGAKIGYDLGRK